MTTTDDATPIRISGPTGLLAVVPTMLGFHPTNSLVLMCLSGDRKRVGPVARVDLAKGHDRAMAEHLTIHAQNHADEVVVISYQNSRRRPPMLDDLLSALARAGIEVMDALVVRGERVRPALNAAMERAHPGFPIPDANDPQVRRLAAAGALAGRTVLSDRDQLRRSIAGPRGARLAQAQRHVDMAAAGRMPAPGISPLDAEFPANTSGPGSPRDSADELAYVLRVGEIPDDVDDLLEQALTQIDTTGEITVEVATALAVLLTETPVRDAVLLSAIAEIDRPWLPMLIAGATWTPDYLAGPLCAVLATVAYRHGDGALAQIAVDRCLAAEPRNGLAHIMIQIMSAGIRPEELDRIARAGLAPTEAGRRDPGCEHDACDPLDANHWDAEHWHADHWDADHWDADSWRPDRLEEDRESEDRCYDDWGDGSWYHGDDLDGGAGCHRDPDSGTNPPFST